MKKRLDVGDLSFTEEEQRKLREQEEKERDAQSEKPNASSPRPHSEAEASLLPGWLRLFGHAKTTRR